MVNCMVDPTKTLKVNPKSLVKRYLSAKSDKSQEPLMCSYKPFNVQLCKSEKNLYTRLGSRYY